MKIENAFKKKQPFIGYLTGGDGGIDYFVNCALALVEGGVDILEIGLPFSDPVADGPVIERAHKRALDEKTTGETLLEIGKRIRKQTNVPMILFSYFNPLLQKGEKYLHDLKTSGFDGVLVVDLPAPVKGQSQDPFFHHLQKAELTPIFLITPSTEEKRLIEINNVAEGFLYYVSQKGTTGVRTELACDFSSQINRIRKHITLPIGAGFGIADKASAKSALEDADGFIVGSAFVKLMEERAKPEELTRLARAIDPRIPNKTENKS